MNNLKKVITLSLFSSTLLLMSPAVNSKAASLKPNVNFKITNYSSANLEASSQIFETQISEKASIKANDVTGQAVVNYAKKFLGIKYAWGGSSPKTGFDCSGFTSYVFSHFNISLPHSANGQKTAGTYASKLLPGDLLCFDWTGNGTVDHVGIYIGDNQFIEAHGTKENPDKVKITDLTNYYKNHLSTQRRLVH